MTSRKRRLISSAVTFLVLGVVSLVYAAWTTNGSGSAYVKAGSSQALTTVDVSATTTTSLYPGVNGDVKIQITNPNTYPVRVTAITGNGAITPTTGGVGCTTSGVTFTNQTGLTIDIAGSSSATVTRTGAASMSNLSMDACQGATFTIPVTLTGASNAA